MLKYWFYGILIAAGVMVLSSGLTESYARAVAYRPTLPYLPGWEDMPEVAYMMYEALPHPYRARILCIIPSRKPDRERISPKAKVCIFKTGLKRT